MIKGEVSVCGTIVNTASEKTAKDGGKFIAFTVVVPIQGKDESVAEIRVQVSAPGDKKTAVKYASGKHVQFTGHLNVRKVDGKEYYNVRCDDACPEAPLSALLDACVEEKLFAEEQRGYVADQVMGELSLSPKDVDDKFHALMASKGSKAATEWFYDYSVKSDYVKKSALDKNPRFESEGLIITINKAKPEFRDPKKAASGNSVKGGYPKCVICHQNEGFSGRNKRTLRTVDVVLDGQKWFWQFSPYGYFYQHGIAVNYEHIPMHVDRGTFTRLMDFVDLFPHYFIGSNAPLERIGGSVCSVCAAGFSCGGCFVCARRTADTSGSCSCARVRARFRLSRQVCAGGSDDRAGHGFCVCGFPRIHSL